MLGPFAGHAAAQTHDKDYACRTLWAPRPAETFYDTSGFNQTVRDAIDAVITNGIMTGCQPGLFCGNASVLRDEMAFFIINARHPSRTTAPVVEPTSFGPATGVFEDVPIEHPLACWAEQFKTEGMTNGCYSQSINGTTRLFFCPQSVMNRMQMAYFLLKAKWGPTYTPPACDPSATRIFCDVSCTTQYAAYIEELWLEGITTGCVAAPNRQYCPSSGATRAQMAIFLKNTFVPPLPSSETRRACTQIP